MRAGGQGGAKLLLLQKLGEQGVALRDVWPISRLELQLKAVLPDKLAFSQGFLREPGAELGALCVGIWVLWHLSHCRNPRQWV